MDEEKKLAAQKIAAATKELNRALLIGARLGLKVEIEVTHFADTLGAGAIVSTETFARLPTDVAPK